MGKILSLCNQKGGVGKTTVSVNLGVGLVREGQKVLLVDADPQGSMTASLGFVEADDIGRTLATVMEELMEDAEIDPFDGILHHEEGVDLVPANIELAGLDVALVNAISRETVMKSFLDELRDSYDWIIIDCMERPFAELNPLEKAAIFEADSGITRDEMAEKYHYSARQVARYLRVSKLIDPLKKMLEEERLAFVSAVYVSFLSEEEQMLVYEVIEAMGARLKPKMAKRLRDQSGELTEEVVTAI